MRSLLGLITLVTIPSRHVKYHSMKHTFGLFFLDFRIQFPPKLSISSHQTQIQSCLTSLVVPPQTLTSLSPVMLLIFLAQNYTSTVKVRVALAVRWAMSH